MALSKATPWLLEMTGYDRVAPSAVGGSERNGLPKLLRPSLTQVVFGVTLIAVGYFAFAAVGGTLLSQRVNQDEQELRREVAQLRQDRAQLEAIREFLWTDEYVEGVARRLLGLVRRGESLVIVSPSTTATPVMDAEPGADVQRRWWERLYVP